MFDPGFFRFAYFDPDYFWSKVAVAFVATVAPFDPYASILAAAQVANAIQFGGSFSEADLKTPFGSIRGAEWVVLVEPGSRGASVAVTPPSEADFASHSVLIHENDPFAEE